MARTVAVFRADLRQVDELVAHVDEGVGLALAAQREIEDAAVEGQRLLDVADLDRDMVHSRPSLGRVVQLRVCSSCA